MCMYLWCCMQCNKLRGLPERVGAHRTVRGSPTGFMSRRYRPTAVPRNIGGAEQVAARAASFPSRAWRDRTDGNTEPPPPPGGEPP